METIQFIFPPEALKAALTVSLLSVWVLVGLFLYLNHYTRRKYFSIWTVAWLFYALWLSLNLTSPSPPLRSAMFVLQHCCVGISALFLFWGSLTFLGTVVRQTLIGLCVGFLLLWSYASRIYIHDKLSVQLPIFLLTGLASISVGFAFYRLGRRMKLIGAGLLFFGFVLWGMFLASYPFAQRYEQFISATFLLSTILHLFIAVSMIVLVLEEVRQTTDQMRREIEITAAEKHELQRRMLAVEQGSSALVANKQLPDELQKAYDELRQTQHSLVQQERLRALGQMASGIAHDINNALSPVVAFSELLLKSEKGLSPNSRKNLEYIRTAGEDIANIVARMRDFYRRRTSHDPLCNLDVSTVIEQAIDMTRPRWRDIPQKRGVTINIRTESAPDLPPLNCQETELREALTNLIANSVDAMPDGGTITISAHTRKNTTETSSLVIEVFDTGTGMTEEVKKHCLEPFFTTKERAGTGLGLSMVYGMMERHRGNIEIDSKPGKGTTIRLVFPLEATATPSIPVRNVPNTIASPLRILCIDDEPLLRELLEEVLKRNGHQVAVADNGTNGIAAFTNAREQGQPFELVITDLGMPDTNGLQVARQIKQVSPYTPVLLLTGWGAIIGEDAMDASAIDLILSKPPNIPQLLEAIAKVRQTQPLERAA